MALEIQKGRSDWWYSRVTVNGAVDSRTAHLLTRILDPARRHRSAMEAAPASSSAE